MSALLPDLVNVESHEDQVVKVEHTQKRQSQQCQAEVDSVCSRSDVEAANQVEQ